VNSSIGSERFLVLTWSNNCKMTGRWSEARMLETMTSNSQTFLCTTISSTSPFSTGE
jgi:hypothetical protein